MGNIVSTLTACCCSICLYSIYTVLGVFLKDLTSKITDKLSVWLASVPLLGWAFAGTVASVPVLWFFATFPIFQSRCHAISVHDFVCAHMTAIADLVDQVCKKHNEISDKMDASNSSTQVNLQWYLYNLEDSKLKLEAAISLLNEAQNKMGDIVKNARQERKELLTFGMFVVVLLSAVGLIIIQRSLKQHNFSLATSARLGTVVMDVACIISLSCYSVASQNQIENMENILETDWDEFKKQTTIISLNRAKIDHLASDIREFLKNI